MLSSPDRVCAIEIDEEMTFPLNLDRKDFEEINSMRARISDIFHHGRGITCGELLDHGIFRSAGIVPEDDACSGMEQWFPLEEGGSSVPSTSLLRPLTWPEWEEIEDLYSDYLTSSSDEDFLL